jgi:D-alanyl-D-alanine carboxypeptidase (penicillin-binding protein 5/6)
MAEKLGGTESRFTALMTLRAQELGMQNTHFVNANGLPDSRQITTARDLAILSRAVMRDYPQYYHYFSQTGFEFHGRHIQGHNHLLGRGIDGLKTGYTRTSGFNIAISGVANNHRLIVVVMGGPSVASRDEIAEDLLLTGFNVMARQDRGERIEVAENLFDRTEEPTGPVQRPPSEQGDGDQANLKIVLAANDPPVHTSSIPIVEPKHSAKLDRADPGRRMHAKADWSVQVGEFRTHAEAKRQISFVENNFGDHLGTSFGAAARAGRRYQTRFNGMSENEARLTCKSMRARGLACEIIPAA